MTQLSATLVRAGASVLAAALVAGCGARTDGPASQTAAKVNKEEITVHQINHVLARQRALPPGQQASATQRVLENLIEQQLALDKASELKLDREPAIVQQLDASRREILARAYFDKVSAGAPKPTPAEIAAYYEANPGLFRDRRIYNLQELAIESQPEQADALRAALAAAKTVPDFVNWLKDKGYKHTQTQGVRSAEQLPLASVAQFAEMKDGQALFRTTPTGALVVTLVTSRTQPVTLPQATPAIEAFLFNDRKRKIVADDLAALRGAAKIEYVGTFAAAAAAASAPTGGTPHPTIPAPTLDSPPVTTLQPSISAASQVEVAPIQSQPASMPASDVLEKGIGGLKR